MPAWRYNGVCGRRWFYPYDSYQKRSSENASNTISEGRINIVTRVAGEIYPVFCSCIKGHCAYRQQNRLQRRNENWLYFQHRAAVQHCLLCGNLPLQFSLRRGQGQFLAPGLRVVEIISVSVSHRVNDGINRSRFLCAAPSDDQHRLSLRLPPAIGCQG